MASKMIGRLTRLGCSPSTNFIRSTRFSSTNSSESFQSGNQKSSSNSSILIGSLAAIAASSATYLYLTSSDDKSSAIKPSSLNPAIAKIDAKLGGISSVHKDYQKVYDRIATLLDDENWDDGSWGPVFVRLAWHASGTYDKESNTGGSNAATMRFAKEAAWGANNGLKAARDRLQTLKDEFPWISYGDLWTLAGVCAIKELGGPAVAWRPGRQDGSIDDDILPDGRLPDASLAQDHLRAIFYRMGFNDQEIVALSGCHSLGRCHTDRSGFDGPWQHSPTSFNNEYFRLLLDEKWAIRKWSGPKQFEDASTKKLMMLPTDLSLAQDKSFRKYVEAYAKDEELFFKDFAAVVARLFELGVPSGNLSAQPIYFKSPE